MWTPRGPSSVGSAQTRGNQSKPLSLHWRRFSDALRWRGQEVTAPLLSPMQQKQHMCVSFSRKQNHWRTLKSVLEKTPPTLRTNNCLMVIAVFYCPGPSSCSQPPSRPRHPAVFGIHQGAIPWLESHFGRHLPLFNLRAPIKWVTQLGPQLGVLMTEDTMSHDDVTQHACDGDFFLVISGSGISCLTLC